MSVTLSTVTFEGIACTPVEVQVQLSPGLPRFTLVGLPDKAVAESRERVRSALHAMGLSLPAKHVTVNLAPAGLAKEGSHFDLPILLGVLVAVGAVPADALAGHMALGELSLDARILPVNGVLPAAMAAAEQNYNLICPQANGGEAAWMKDAIDVLAAPDALALINHLRGTQLLPEPQCRPAIENTHATDMAQVIGQQAARRALEVAAAGGHNLLMSGPPGAGKSLLASCLPGILPEMNAQEMLEVSMIASVAGTLPDGRIQQSRPFRSPHHSSSMAAMVGGGRKVVPGEISLAHRGVLFLDELPEFQKPVLEALRQPMETGEVAIARANAHVTYPARFQMIAAMNPCRCGYLGDPGLACSKAPRCGLDYQSRLSGPLLDRMDLQVELPASQSGSLLRSAPGESSAVVAGRVAAARELQAARFKRLGLKIHTNAELNGSDWIEQIELEEAARKQLEQAADHFQLSMRAVARLLKVARTIADLAGSEVVMPVHTAEAIGYRRPDWLRNGGKAQAA